MSGSPSPTPASAPSRRALILLLLIALSVGLQGLRPLWEPDEGRYALVAMEMLRSGDWLHPELHPLQPHYTKPPLSYWALAASISLFGRTAWAVRLPGNLAFLLTLLLVVRLARGWGWREPWSAGLAFGSLLLPFLARNIVTTDPLLLLFETLGVAGLALAAADRPRELRWSLVGWIGFALAFLTKGPPGLLPLLALAVFAAVERRRRGLRWIAHPLPLAAFFVLAGSWYAVVLIDSPELLDYFLRHEVAGRVLSSEHNRNPQWYGPLKIYLPTLLIGCLPLTWVLLRRLPALLRGSTWRRWARERPERLLLGLWVLLPLAVFCAARSRLHLYLLPLFVPLALLASSSLRRPLLATRLRTGLLAVWLVALSLIFPLSTQFKAKRNSLLFSERVRELSDGPVDELVFLGGPPAYGLGFYLDLRVRAAPDREKDPDRLAQWIAHERQTRPLERLWISGPFHREILPRSAALLGCRVRDLGSFARWSLHRLDCGDESP